MIPDFDLIIRNDAIYDGSGNPPVTGDVGVNGEAIAAIGSLRGSRGRRELDAQGFAVAPGFINMLSWANRSLLEDGRSQSDIRQGVTLEVMGEGSSMGPLTDTMKRQMREQQGDIKYAIEWTTLGEYLEHLVGRGVSCNVASFVGATTVRVHEVGYTDRPPAPGELGRMQHLVGEAMAEGALGVASALIYAPAFYAKTDELIALCQAAAEYDGMYISHLHSESGRLLEAADELIRIAREAHVPAEIYHLKVAGQPNWPKLEPGHYADIVIFDPTSIRDHATFEQPHQYATGVRDVFVNGAQVLRDGEHTGAKPGQVVRGPGWKKT
jgi:N-acyl-D-amino-acid deacylase